MRKNYKKEENMITKERARDIYNHYSQIEECEKFMSELKSFIDEQVGNDPKLLGTEINPRGNIQIQIPYFEKGKFKDTYRIFGLDYPTALRVIKSHVRRLKKELAELQKEE